MASVLVKLCAFGSVPWRMVRTSLAPHSRIHYDTVKCFSMKVKPSAPPWSSGGKRIERVSSRNSYESPLPHEPRHHPKVVDGEVEDEMEHFSPRENKRMQRPGKGSFQVERCNASELKYLRDDDSVKKTNRPQKQPAAFELSEGSEILFGVAPCHLALSQSRRNFLNLFLKSTLKPERPEIQEIFKQAEARGVPVHHVKRHILDSLCKDRVHQGVCMEVTPLRYEQLDGEQQGVAESELVGPEKRVLWLVLEGMQDPMNVGAILRTAYFLGVTRVLSSQTNSCSLTPTVSKASAGTMELLEVFGVDDLPEVLQEKIEQGWQVLGTVGKTEALEGVPIITTSEFQWNRPTILVLGNEGHGLSSEIRSRCQMMLTIPPGRVLHPGIESLNVSVAAGILLHGLYSQRT